MSKTKVKNTKSMGRGVFAAQSFNKNQIVEVSPCLNWDDRTQDIVQNSTLRFYVFKGRTYNESVLALGNGSLFNHNPKGNITYDYDAKRNVMVFKAIRTIKAGEQLFINYGYDPMEKLEEWKRQKSYEIERKRKELDESLAVCTPSEKPCQELQLEKPRALIWPESDLLIKKNTFFNNDLPAALGAIALIVTVATLILMSGVT